MDASTLIASIDRIPTYRYFGRVTAILGTLVEVGGVENRLSVGGRVQLLARDRRRVACEVVGFRENRALLMAFGPLDGIGVGCQAEIADSESLILISFRLIGTAMMIGRYLILATKE